MKMTKKALLTLGTVSAITAPIAAVVSCASIGKQKDTGPINVDGVFNGITLRVGTRLDERPFLEPALKEFSQVTGARIRYEGATPSQYSVTQSSRSGLADVTLVEGEGTNIESQEQSWFAPFRLKTQDHTGLLDNPTYNNIQYGHGYELNPNLDLTDPTQTDTATFRSAKNKIGALAGTGTLNYLPAVLGPRLIYGWRKDGNNKDMYDGAHDLKWFVPKSITSGAGLDEVNFTNENDNPLLKADGSHYKNTVEDIEEFLLNSAKEEQRKFNQTDYNLASLKDANPRKRLIATGQEGYKQRLYSVVKSLQDSGFNLGMIGILEYSSIDIAMIANGMSSILRTADATRDAYNGDMVDDSKWAEGFAGATPQVGNLNHRWDLSHTANVTSSAPDAYIKMWLGQFGYLNSQVAGLKQLIRAQAESAAFSQKRVGFFNGQKWVQPELLATSGVAVKDIDKEFVSFPEPFSDPGVDGYAVKSGLEGKKKDAAFALLRFLMQEKVQSQMSGSKTLPIINAARRAKINDPSSSMFDKTAAKSGFGDIPANKRLVHGHDIVSRSSTNNVLNEMSMLAEKNSWSAATNANITWNDFTGRMEEIRFAWTARAHLNNG